MKKTLALAKAMGKNIKVDIVKREQSYWQYIKTGKHYEIEENYYIEEFDGGGYRWFPLGDYFTPLGLFEVTTFLRLKGWNIGKLFCKFDPDLYCYYWACSYYNSMGEVYSAESYESEIDARLQGAYKVLTGGKDINDA